MKDFYGQKEIPDIKIKQLTIDTLTDFDLRYSSDDCVEINFSIPILTKRLKKKILTGQFLGATMTVLETIRREDGKDVVEPMKLKIKEYAFEYHLGCKGEPARYEFNFECDYE